MRFAFALLFVLLAAGCGIPSNRAIFDRERVALDTFLFDRLDMRLHEEEGRGAICGGTLAIRHRGQLVYSNAFGRECTTRGSRRAAPETLFDAASLAKPLYGAPLKLALDHAAGRDVRGALDHTGCFDDAVAMPMLLARMAELPAGEAGRVALLREIADGSILGEACTCEGRGCRYRYANAGFIAALEEVPPDYVRAMFWEPAGAASLTFRPPAGGRVACSGFAKDGTPIAGSPYDRAAAMLLNKFAIDPPHSGLFATAEGAAQFAEAVLLADGSNPELAMLRGALFSDPVRLRASDPEAAGATDVWVTRGGMLSPADRPFGAYWAPPGRFLFHTGYTGCLLWIDTQSETVLVLLTNASATGAFAEFQALAEDAVQQAIQSLPRG